MRQVRLAERQGLLTGRRLNEAQEFALDLLMYQEWWDKQSADPLAQQVRQGISEGLYDEAGDVEGDLEDYSAVQWQAPSDIGQEEVMGDIERFNQAMAANSHMVVEDGGEWL